MSHISVNPKFKITNPKQILNSKHQKSLLFVILDLLFKRSVLICLLFGALNLVLTLAPPARANTDPKSATPSATATVPSTPATSSDSQAPTSPILVRPVDATITSDPKPEFVWKTSSDPNGNTVLYTLYLNGVATYLGVSNIGNSGGNNYTARLESGEIKLLPSQSLADGIYTWYVTASDPSGNTARSTTWTLRIDTAPPPLTLVDLDNYHLPSITEGAKFEIAGPKDIYFTVLSDPYADIQITISSPYYIHSSTNAQGLAYLYQHLSPGVYTVSILALDRANLTTLLPDFELTITQALISIPGLPPSYSIPYTPYSIPSLPATVAKIETRSSLPLLLIILLAVILSILPIILWYKRRYNLIILDSSLRPLSPVTLYHSRPYTPGVKGAHLPRGKAGTPGVLSILHTPSSKLYLPHLSRFSTLTIRLQNKNVCTTYILSICTKQRLYTIVLG